MDADGGNLHQLSTNGSSQQPDWSHDGSRITFSGIENGNKDIYVIPADGSDQEINLTNSQVEDSNPIWSPDSSQIAWLSGKDGNWDIFVMNADGSNVRQLTNNGKVSGISWTVDGQIFTIWDSAEHGCCNFVMNADGTNILPAGGKTELQRYLPFWTLEGDRVELAQAGLNGRDEEIYLVGTIYPDTFFNLTNNPANDRNPDWPANCGPVD